MRKSLVWYVFLILVFSSCKKDPISEISIQWKKDKFGCTGYRTSKNTDLLLSKANLTDKHFEEAQKYFGTPDTMLTSTAVYYLDGKCENNRLKDSSDVCCLFIYLDNDIVKKWTITCT